MKHIKEYEEFEYEELNEGIVGDIWERFKALIKKIFNSPDKKNNTPIQEPTKPPTPTPVKPQTPPQIEGQHMLYLPHQQGPSGAAKIFKIAKGEGKLDPFMRNKLLKNMPQSDSRYIKVKTGKDQEAVLAFLDYQKSTWDNYKKAALKEIRESKHSQVKEAIEKVKNKQLTSDFLTTVAYKESRFNPNPSTNKSYTGLFQIGDLAWKQLKKIDPQKYKGEKPPVNALLNSQAGHDYLKWSYEQFEKLIK
jgi:hypothetical protein